jgi:hypothetical protein
MAENSKYEWFPKTLNLQENLINCTVKYFIPVPNTGPPPLPKKIRL